MNNQEILANADQVLHNMIHEVGVLPLNEDHKKQAEKIIHHLDEAHGLIHDLSFELNKQA